MLKSIGLAGLAALFAGAAAASQSEMDLRTAVAEALETNPEVLQAVENRRAVAFERRQARALYGPTVSFEGSAGFRELDNPSREAAGLGDETLEPLEASLFAEQVIFDGLNRHGEARRQYARLQGASSRVEERAEFIALEVGREYVNLGLQERLVVLARENIDFHEGVVNRLAQGVESRTVSATDLQQARERLAAASRRFVEAQRDRAEAGFALERLVGAPIAGYVDAPRLGAVAPQSLAEAVETARENNPQILIAQAGVGAAEGEMDSARSGYLPRVSLEGRVRTGEDIDAFSGDTTDAQVRAVVRWTLFDSGRSIANVSEQARRVDESRYRLHQVQREVDQEVRVAYERLERERELIANLRDQARFADEVVEGYASQFAAGQRSLLDLLDAQNSRLSVRQLLATSEHALIFAEYRLLAAAGGLVEALELEAPVESRLFEEETQAAPEDAEQDDPEGWLRRVLNRLPGG